jgi:L-fuculose-phosphate aldolase
MLKADLKTSDLVPVDLSGRARGGTRQPTTELDLHLALYRADPGIGAVVHAHPPIATGHAVAGVSLDCSALPELLLLMGRTVPLVPFAIPGTPEVGVGVAPLAARHHAALLANHGAVTWGTDLRMAQVRMESLEHAARILAAARAVGRIRRIPRPAIDVLSPRMGRKRDG